MSDDFNSLSNRLLTRCPAAGILLAQQLVNDSWRTLQARREWSFRRKSGIFAPPNLYATGTVSTNVSTGQPTLLTGVGTTWTPTMIGSQIRVGGLLYPYYSIVGYLSPTTILIDTPWAGPDVVGQSYAILQLYFPVPDDFNYFYVVLSPKDGYRLWTTVSQSDLGLLDPQRTNVGQTYSVVFRDYSPSYGGVVGPIVPIAATGAVPISATTNGYTYIANATYIIQVTGTGVAGVATFKWMRFGQTGFQPDQVTSADPPNDLMDGVQVYWPDGVSYTSGDLFVINATSQIGTGGPRYELWPAPTSSLYLYPYMYVAKESDLSPEQPNLPPFMASRGEVILEMALAACARFPGADVDKPNPYYSLNLSRMHEDRVRDMLIDLERNDEEIDVTQLTYQDYPMAPSPWMDGGWQQRHAPFMSG